MMPEMSVDFGLSDGTGVVSAAVHIFEQVTVLKLHSNFLQKIENLLFIREQISKKRKIIEISNKMVNLSTLTICSAHFAIIYHFHYLAYVRFNRFFLATKSFFRKWN